ncbi:endo alpha-1,4 polygalactosaminidase [Hahella ganghwensis]|uniref:endo alpha-1,4 polygalactosaminidase n=1 Tax=Hahella ganghwensis TaxID=286420 RepID=UPI00036FB310|nr:endo alpha-1,4 polygalactosaminidase [Hahella ganghwensis]
MHKNKSARHSLALVFTALLPLSATSQALTLEVDNIVVREGYISSQPIEVLGDMSQSGSEDNWDEYIEFSPDSDRFKGDFIFELPAGLEPEDLASLVVESNFMGESRNNQRWLFKIRDYENNRWIVLGDNSDINEWEWHNFWLEVSGDAADFVNHLGQIRVRYQSNNSVDISNLDYMALEVALHGDDGGTDPGDGGTDPDDPGPNPYWWQPTPGDNLTWQWQLQGNIDHNYDVHVYDVDLFNVSVQEIAQLKSEGRTVICYFSAGTYEGWRSEWREHFDFITSDSYNGSEPPFAGNMAEWDERWLDIRRIDLLEPIMTSRLDLAVEKGCDAVEPDNMDAWTNSSEVRLNPALTGDDQLAYNKWLARQAHERGLSIGLKNDIEQLTELVDHFDWALNEQCFQYNECEAYSVFTNADKAVFGVEYQGDPANFCARAKQLNLQWMKKKLDLYAWRQGCEDY